MGKFNSSPASRSGAQISRFTEPFPTGAGADGSDGGITTNIQKINGEIVTTISVSYTHLTLPTILRV